MGQEIAHIAQKRNHTITFTIDPYNTQATAPSLSEVEDNINTTDIVIEFSTPDAVLDNARVYADKGIHAIVGTTGWDDKKSDVQTLITQSDIAYVHGGNFSIGAHIFMRAAQYTARMLNKIEDYDVSIMESHHIQKQDRPSGTALMTAELVLQELARKETIMTDLPASTPVDTQALAVVSQRVGHELGHHEVVADSAFDTITLTHHARTRGGFALGAVLAAEWVLSRYANNNPIQGCISVHDFINEWLLADPR